ncbi:type III polyketide synthase [Hoeflea prorocentri]|uniref:Type III polyketide synthase n=1 Tax=Hoeflea prorocentri TaxID=1922333 RepID=A0A9X3UM74_9HYPH|nr:3-oxoacyl-[acyl-carrier-protein] synthase III C-terminal domain-containing protein [Hoeflea prorocentri]MCY6381651.1 type III polyketide synthase [Hoeflea prorocentri]MDA5399451.1 type III polyketide synthase [Hoeflea prorocentri]
MSVKLVGISTAVPGEKIPQTIVLDWARRTLGSKFSQFERMSKAFENAGIDTRYTVADTTWFETPKSMSERNDAYLTGSTALFVKAAKAALDDAQWTAEDVDVVVTVSSTGIATPSLEARALSKMGFRDDVMRVPVFGLGCAGGVSGMAIARDLAAAREAAKVLMVAVEACSVSFCSGVPRKADIIGAALFGDGAAAVCLTTGKESRNARNVVIGTGTQKIWPDTLSIMGWEVDDNSLGVVFDKAIPDFTRTHLQAAVTGALADIGKDADQIDRFVFHPGGTKVLQAIEQSLDLQPDSLGIERQVLRDFGNMSAPTVLFVLKQVLETDHKGDMLMGAFGPGFTASFLPVAHV